MSDKSEPALYGFDSNLSPVTAKKPVSSLTTGTSSVPDLRTRRSYQETGVKFVPVQLPVTHRGRANTFPLQSVPENAELPATTSKDSVQAPSFEWDTYGENESLVTGTHPLNSTRRWSFETQFSVPVASNSSNAAATANLLSEEDEDEFLSPSPDEEPGDEGDDLSASHQGTAGGSDDSISGGGVDLSEPGDADEAQVGGQGGGGGEDDDDDSNEGDGDNEDDGAEEDGDNEEGGVSGEDTEEEVGMDVLACRRKAAKAILEADEDVLPFAGRPVNLECLNRLCTLAQSLKRELQEVYLEMQGNAAYPAADADRAATCRTALINFLVEAEERRAVIETENRTQRAETDAAAAATAAAAAEAKKPYINRKVKLAADELKSVVDAFEEFVAQKPKTDEELFEKVDQLRVLEGRHDAAAAEAKETARLALEFNLILESGELEDDAKAARNQKQHGHDAVVRWRREAGVWTEKRRRGDRGEVKAPTFTAGISSKMTVYEFEKEWNEYSQAMEYSKAEAVKMLKQAIQPPTKGDVADFETVEAIFEHLKKHHGNPMMLLHAKEQEVRGWERCTGTAIQQREWLVRAKGRLQSIVKMCKDHKIEEYLHFSTVAGDIQSKFSPDIVQDYQFELLKHMNSGGNVDREKMIGILTTFLERRILLCTLAVNLDITAHAGANLEQVQEAQAAAAKHSGGGGGKKGGIHAITHQQGNSGGGSSKRSSGNGGKGKKSSSSGDGGGQSIQVDDKCVTCGGNHRNLFYCENYINSDVQARFEMVKAQQACARCLGMRVKLTGPRQEWHVWHKKYCTTKFACQEDTCSKRPQNKQFHITLCKNHTAQNKNREAEFIRSLDKTQLPANCKPSGLTFLHMGTWLALACKDCDGGGRDSGGGARIVDAENSTTIWRGEKYEVYPDVYDAAVFMMQNLPSPKSTKARLLVFYDSGCGSAGISDRAYHLLETTTVRKGPTLLDVAGGKCVEIPYGDEQLNLELADGKKLATITALRMPTITTAFPYVKLTEAWEELAAAATKKGIRNVPTIDDDIGGTPVDVILGIRYLKYYPKLVFSLPSGLGVYRAQFKSASGHQAVLGGPHAAWSMATEAAGHMSARAYLTQEARAWCVQESWVRLNQKLFSELPEESQDCCCGGQETATATAAAYQCLSARTEEKRFWSVESVGTEAPYRCDICRNCQKCKRADQLEVISFKEESEQALIEAGIEFKPEENKIVAYLPFIEDPATALKPNRSVAEQIFRGQLALFKKKPEMREDTLRSHTKLVQRGYVKTEDQLSTEERAAMTATPGSGYFIPWRIVHNENSLSTPCRMVFDASSKTPGGNSLNGVLAKGKNRLVKLLNLLARFRQRPAAFTADISMAYNGTRLRPEHFKWQKYLWKEDLQEEKPTVVMYIVTLIYGVKPSGAQCQASIERVARHFEEQGLHEEAATILQRDVYVDDIISGSGSVQECYEAAQGVLEILTKGGMKLKAFTFSGQPPSEEVSADGTHVSVGGYLWRPEEDVLLLDIGPHRFGKPKRGIQPPPVTGDFGVALSRCFTRRTVTGIVAKVFDPLGLATPVTARLKLDLHDLCLRKLDWDDPAPPDLLPTWAAHMSTVQELKSVHYKRAFIPIDAQTDIVDLLVAVDASQHLAAVAIYARVLRKNGRYSCQLILARSKLVNNLTIPRAEMKAAVMGAVSSQVVKSNLGGQLGEVIYVSDSTVCLHWIHQEDRPLQVAVRNAVIEIRRFTDVNQWLHVDSENNIADLATRTATISDIQLDSPWQTGYEWMTRPRGEMPLRTVQEIVLTAEEKRLAAAETRAKDILGHTLHFAMDNMAARYSLSDYVLDPCRFSWPKVVRILALAMRWIEIVRIKITARKAATSQGVNENIPGKVAIVQPNQVTDPPKTKATDDPVDLATKRPKFADIVYISTEELQRAERYYFKKATKEVLRYSKEKDYKNCSEMREGILYFTGRLLDGQSPQAFETVMFDLNPLSFCRPIVDRHSPVAYSIMAHVHWTQVNHLSTACTFRESLSTAYILGGRNLAQEIRNTCVYCRRYKAKLLEVEMGKIHDARLTVAPPFTLCQVDLLGPYRAQCEHNHRSTVKVWGAIFKDPASGAVFVAAMSKCDTSSYLMAYTRFASRYCHPQKLYPDAGSQLLQACKEMEVSWLDVAHTLNANHGVGVEFYPCPVGGHNAHGMVERSIREVKKLFNTVYSGIKLDLLGYETAFSWISNEMNNLPLCIGPRYRDMDHLDLLTPNRLIHGRANKRALSGTCTYGTPSTMLARMEEVFTAWWQAWADEKIADFVAKPTKWTKSDPPLKVGDVVIFLKEGTEQVLGEPIWRIGKVAQVETSEKDGLVRAVTVQYKNISESKYRTTRRSVRTIAVLHREGDLELAQQLNAAARMADKFAKAQENYMQHQESVFREVQRCQMCVPPMMCQRHTQFFLKKPVLITGPPIVEEANFLQCESELCAKLKIHSDPWP